MFAVTFILLCPRPNQIQRLTDSSPGEIETPGFHRLIA